MDATELPEYPPPVDFRTPEEEIDRDARMALITDLIESLPPKLQAVLILQCRAGLTYEEIAVRLGVSTHAVKKYAVQGPALCPKRLTRSEGCEL